MPTGSKEADEGVGRGPGGPPYSQLQDNIRIFRSDQRQFAGAALWTPSFAKFSRASDKHAFFSSAL